MPKILDGAAVGIDFGTTCSRVGIWNWNDSKRCDIIGTDFGNRATLSSVVFTENRGTLSSVVFTDAASRQAVASTSNTVFGARRLVGRKMDELDALCLYTAICFTCIYVF